MTDEEIKNKAKETSSGNYYYEQGFIYGFELGEENGKKEKCLEQNKDGTIRPCEVMKENEEQKVQISILLSCKECPENKGGYICAKEYNDKCLSQKIQHIKELKEENELMGQIIQDLLKKSDGCYVCEAKGQKGYLCECKNEPECVNHIIELYRSSK